MKDYEILKKKYGEEFAKFCRSNFSTILEEEGKLSEIILSKFAPSKFLYDDIVNNNLEQDFKNYIFYFFDINGHKKEKVDETPEELMEKAGYKLYYCKNNRDILKFKKYYKRSEELCTFTDPYRINDYTIFFAVKKNVDDIKRENFTSPRRQDEYGTSVISLQFSKGEESTLSIKNRYNHTVENPDATFSNNLENIYMGLTDSFEKYYNIKLINGKQSFELPNYVMAKDGKFYRYNYEFRDVYYCPNNVIIDDGNVSEYNKDIYELIDYFIVDKKNCKIFKAPRIFYRDGFVDSVESLEKIEITKTENNQRIFKIVNNKKEQTYLTVNKYNQIIKYTNAQIKEMDSAFFMLLDYLEEFNVENVEIIYNSSLREINNLKKFNAPNLKQMSDGCLQYADSLTIFNAPNIIEIGSNCLEYVNNLTVFNAPNLLRMGDKCLRLAKNLKEFNASNLQVVGNQCLREAKKLKVFNTPHNIRTGYGFLKNAKNIKVVFKRRQIEKNMRKNNELNF